MKEKKKRIASLLSFIFLSILLLGGYSSSAIAQEKATSTFTLLPEVAQTATEIPPTASNTPEKPLPEIPGDYAEGEILVKFISSTGDARAVTKDCFVNEQAQITRELGAVGASLLEFENMSVAEAIAQAEKCPNILFAEPNYHLYATDTFPNDPNFGNQYGLIAIHAPEGWDTTTGSAAVIIAIIDTGVDLTHVDLAGKIVAGYDFVNNDAVAQDDNGHGSHVAGIAAASSNNGVGVAGTSWGARIMPVKVLDSGAGGYFADAAAGIIWATDHGAHIINLSLGSTTHSQIFKDAIDYAYNHGVTLVAASGNSGSGIILYPARYPNVIAVGATDNTNTLAGFSNYGAELDVVAPGVDIYSTGINTYFLNSGTSMATPYVSGLVAILRGIPGSGSPANLAWAIKSTALDLGVPGRDNYYGDGLIQMDSAIQLLWVTPTSTPTQTFTPTHTLPVLATATDGWVPISTFTYTPSPTITPSATFTPSATIAYPDLPGANADEPELVALASPTQDLLAEEAENKKGGRYIFPCFGVLAILVGIFLFWLGAKMKNNRNVR